MAQPLTFAVPKGRILDEALPVMARAGLVPESAFHDKGNRALAFACEGGNARLIRVRAFDVATFVAFGAAQAGIVGSDVIEEFDFSELYAPVDLAIGHCRLSLAEPAGARREPGHASHIRVATKYPNLTKRWFEGKGVQAECIKLNGAMGSRHPGGAMFGFADGHVVFIRDSVSLTIYRSLSTRKRGEAVSGDVL